MKKFLRISAVVATLMISYVAFSSHVSWGEWSCDKTPSGTGHCAPATLGSGTMCFSDITTGDLCDGSTWNN